MLLNELTGFLKCHSNIWGRVCWTIHILCEGDQKSVWYLLCELRRDPTQEAGGASLSHSTVKELGNTLSGAGKISVCFPAAIITVPACLHLSFLIHCSAEAK